MAHPGLNRSDEVIPDLVSMTWTSSNVFTRNIRRRYPSITWKSADKFNLLVTGGSDCHGFSKGKPLIGTVRLPYEHVEKLKTARDKRSAAVSASSLPHGGAR